MQGTVSEPMRFITDQGVSHTNAIDTQKTKKYHKNLKENSNDTSLRMAKRLIWRD